MNEAQLTRFEFFIRSHLSRSKIKFILQESVGYQNAHRISDEMRYLLLIFINRYIFNYIKDDHTVLISILYVP